MSCRPGTWAVYPGESSSKECILGSYTGGFCRLCEKKKEIKHEKQIQCLLNLIGMTWLDPLSHLCILMYCSFSDFSDFYLPLSKDSRQALHVRSWKAALFSGRASKPHTHPFSIPGQGPTGGVCIVRRHPSAPDGCVSGAQLRQFCYDWRIPASSHWHDTMCFI